MRVFFSLLAILAAFLGRAYFFSPVSEAAPVSLSAASLRVFGDNRLLQKAVSVPGVMAPEGFAETVHEGRKYVFMSTMTGAIVRLKLVSSRTPQSEDFVVVVRMGSAIANSSCEEYSYEKEPLCGRPLGLSWDPEGNLVVCETYSGIFRIDRNVLFLENGAPKSYRPELILASGPQFRFLNVALYWNGSLYFTDSSSEYQRRDVPLSLLDGRSLGRLFRYNPSNKSVHLIADQLGFSNGLAIVGDELLVAMSSSMRIMRYRPSDGSFKLFAHLPCLPDNLVHLKKRHLLSVGCAGVRTSFLEFLFRWPAVRRLLAGIVPAGRLLSWIPRHGAVLLLDDKTGLVRRTWEDPGGLKRAVVSEALEFGGYVFLGSWRPEDSLSYLVAGDHELWPTQYPRAE